MSLCENNTPVPRTTSPARGSWKLRCPRSPRALWWSSWTAADGFCSVSRSTSECQRWRATAGSACQRNGNAPTKNGQSANPGIKRSPCLACGLRRGRATFTQHKPTPSTMTTRRTKNFPLPSKPPIRYQPFKR